MCHFFIISRLCQSLEEEAIAPINGIASIIIISAQGWFSDCFRGYGRRPIKQNWLRTMFQSHGNQSLPSRHLPVQS